MVDIMSFDPGVTTGVATLDGDSYRSFHIEPRKYPHPHEALHDVIAALQPKVLVYEAFHFRQNMNGVVFTGVEYIGVIELYGQTNCLEIIKISPSDGKGFWDDRKLKVINVHNPGHVHANDAMRLLLRYRMKNPLFMETVLPKLKEL